MFNNNKNFYPTPKKLINRMLQDIDFRNVQTILEPSAGKGDLVEEVIKRIDSVKYKSYYHNDEKKYDVDCIELDENLRYILQGKGYRVVHDDFLTYDTFKQYDLIIANFPFNEGDKHLLKALNMISKGGQLIALINAETLKNSYSNIRKDILQKLDRYNADIEYLQDEFINAERITKVEVALIKVKIENKNNDSLILNKLKQEEKYNQEQRYEKNNLIDGNFVNGIIQQYNLEVKAGLNLINEYNNLHKVMLQSLKDNKYTDIILKLTTGHRNNDDYDTLENYYVKKTRYKYWEALFNNEKFTSLLTSNLLYEYRNKISELENYDFSLYNIKEIQKQMSKSMIKGVEDTILELFDEFSYKHSWYNETSSNIHYYNGWKSNNAFKINKKVIIPLSAYSDIFNNFSYSYKFYEKLKDIEHTFNYLDEGITEESNLKGILTKAENEHQTKDIITKHFKISTYKKGTTHLTFLNEDLLEKFNIFGGKHKNFLPNNFGNINYNDMTKEEKEVVNNFCGKDRYNKIINNSEYYIFNPQKTLMLSYNN